MSVPLKPTNKIKWLIGFIVAALIVVVGFLFYLSFKSNTNGEAVDKKSDNIDVNYPKSNDPETQKLLEEDKAYQEKITSFDFAKYPEVKANLANAESQDKCVNGFGGHMRKIQQGIFSEPLYSLNAEKLETDNGGFGYAPYVNAYYVVGDILFKKPMDYFDRQIITYEQLTRNFADSRAIIGNTAFKNSYSTMESKFGFPQAYLKQQAGLIVGLSAFNDGCVKDVGLRNIHFDRVDLSGIPVTALFSSKYRTALFHGMNGLYNYTDKTPDFVSPDFLDWIHSNNLIYQNLVNQRDKYLFPRGSYLFVPVKYDVQQEIVTVNFKDEPLNIKLNTILTDIAKQNQLQPTDITFVEEEFNDFKIHKPVRKKDLEKVVNFAIAEKNGKLFYATWELPTTINITGLEADRSNLVLMNATALQYALGVIKSNYQGKKFDVGTANQNLDIKSVEAQSPEALKDIENKKQILKQLMHKQDGTVPQPNKKLGLDENTIPTDENHSSHALEMSREVMKSMVETARSIDANSAKSSVSKPN